PLPRCSNKRGQRLTQELRVFAGTIFQHEGKASRSSHTWNRRGWKRESNPFSDLRELLVQALLDCFVLFLRRLALCPSLKRDPVKGTVCILGSAQHAVTQHRRHRL